MPVFANPFLILPMLGEGGYDEQKRRAKELPARYKLVREDHNAWLKGFIGDSRTKQGDHRLRKYVATQIYWGEIECPWQPPARGPKGEALLAP